MAKQQPIPKPNMTEAEDPVGQQNKIPDQEGSIPERLLPRVRTSDKRVQTLRTVCNQNMEATDNIEDSK